MREFLIITMHGTKRTGSNSKKTRQTGKVKLFQSDNQLPIWSRFMKKGNKSHGTVPLTPSYQSWARDNSVATMWPCFKATKLFVIAILVYLLYWFFSGPWLVPEAVLRCRIAKLNNCCVPSSASYSPCNKRVWLAPLDSRQQPASSNRMVQTLPWTLKITLI